MYAIELHILENLSQNIKEIGCTSVGVYVYVSMSVSVDVCEFVLLCLCSHTHAHTYTHTHSNTHTRKHATQTYAYIQNNVGPVWVVICNNSIIYNNYNHVCDLFRGRYERIVSLDASIVTQFIKVIFATIQRSVTINVT